VSFENERRIIIMVIIKTTTRMVCDKEWFATRTKYERGGEDEKIQSYTRERERQPGN